MGSETNEGIFIPRPRSNRNDLIDLSGELEDGQSNNNILNLFDPLAGSREADIKRKDTHRARSSTRSTPYLELTRPNRRYRATSACTIPRIEDVINSRRTIKFNESVVDRAESKPDYTDDRQFHYSVPSQSSAKSSITRHDKLSLRSSTSTLEATSNSSCSDKSELREMMERKLINELDSNQNRLKLARKHERSGPELASLSNKIKSFRSQFKSHDLTTNSGIVYSQTLYSSKVREMSVKIIITSPLASQPINFTCNVSTTIEHLISHAVCTMFENLNENDSMDNYMLKVTGKDEYFDSKLSLADYALVTHCWKFDLDVMLTLVKIEAVKRSFMRTDKDDFHCKSRLCSDDLLSRSAYLKFSDLNYEALSIVIETFEREAQSLYFDVTNRSRSLQTTSLLQTTKAICSLMMNCETSLLTEAKDNIAELCNTYKNELNNLNDDDKYKMIEVIHHAIKRLVDNMKRLLHVTSSHLPVDYEVMDVNAAGQQNISFVDTPISQIKDQLLLRLQLVSRLKPEWLLKYNEFYISATIMHGTSQICESVTSSIVKIDTSSFFHRLLLDEDLLFLISYSSLPREARIIFTLIGIELPPINNQDKDETLNRSDEPIPIRRSNSITSVCSTAPMYMSSPKDSNNKPPLSTIEPIRTDLAKSVTYIFDQELNLYQGDRLLHMYPLSDEEPDEDMYIEVTADRDSPVLFLEFRKFPIEKKIHFPHVSIESLVDDSSYIKDYEQLDAGTKYVLSSIIDEKQSRDELMDDEKSLLWENRAYLTSKPAALPKFLLSVPDWSAANLDNIYQLLSRWSPLDPVDAIQLLLPPFPDINVRQLAIDWISKQQDDELCDYLPQLLQAFRYEKNIDCPLFWLLIRRALQNVRIANMLYWNLKLSTSDKLIQERSETLINCLLWTCGSAFWKSIDKQEELLVKLIGVSKGIKKARDGQRKSLLMKKLEPVQDYLNEKKPTMPWAPSLEVCDLELRSCSYFPSNTLPLKLAFRSCEESCNRQVKLYTYDAIFKIGDDLRQDMLAIQIIRIMEKLWLREGLDLKMVTFDCIATGQRQGFVEMVSKAETLRKIHQNTNFLAGSFNPKAIDNYIRLWNTSELEYKTALDNFLHSCAGYAVATYILGICDRHNDNIMVTTAGHLFHIDFGKFLGDAQMMGSIKRDRTPFVLTADMAYVINGGDKPSKKFQTFIELCTMGFNIIRRYRNLFLNLFALMASARIHGLNNESIKYIDKMLMPELTETEAMARFTRLIDECLNSRSTQVNFFIHNLAQLRFTNDNSRQTLLSFVPKTFSIRTDGRIESLDIVQLYKKYEPEKQYYYVVRVKRFNQPDSTDITRTFREFSELQMKLNCLFPSNQFHDINKSTSSFLMDFVGRNNTREIAERRLYELNTFLKRLMLLPPEVSECDLIYTFFHPILRDQATNNGDISLLSESSSTFGSQEYNEAQRHALYLNSNGQVKLSLAYKNGTLTVMIMHAKNLSCLEGSISPNCYAKTYLLPDPLKQTKRKTRVIRQSCHPTFMELIVYKIPFENLKNITLQVSIWHSELVQYKAFMGAALIPLDIVDPTKELTSWYPLKNF